MIPFHEVKFLTRSLYRLTSCELCWFKNERSSYGEFFVFQKTVTIHLFYK